MRTAPLFLAALALAVTVGGSSHASTLVWPEEPAQQVPVASPRPAELVTVKVMGDDYNPPPPVTPVS